jgi:hypothetical protein
LEVEERVRNEEEETIGCNIEGFHTGDVQIREGSDCGGQL